ncbi:Kunitz/Bovine pancreatic trypsin inhibitor domain protein [Ancylostoma duodenale]|uniref:Kunitz/Bovine pancreatic trypsin inhibitor domain protein n=1 Tax=Ancylostoma duodenale TaxID=51022 RepID=A0A0C2GLM0_9BILA|nr:Kunitz/Bovine pancreatic trypsin inhibitor domain protein [Ancylostoma duodenale]
MKCLLVVLLCVAVAYCVSDAKRCNAPTHLPGPQCMAFFQRYTYNKAKKQCEEFIFGGCNPSPNNFETMEECKKTCMK